jgi:hypothetical protein
MIVDGRQRRPFHQRVPGTRPDEQHFRVFNEMPSEWRADICRAAVDRWVRSGNPYYAAPERLTVLTAVLDTDACLAAHLYADALGVAP